MYLLSDLHEPVFCPGLAVPMRSGNIYTPHMNIRLCENCPSHTVQFVTSNLQVVYILTRRVGLYPSFFQASISMELGYVIVLCPVLLWWAVIGIHMSYTV